LACRTDRHGKDPMPTHLTTAPTVLVIGATGRHGRTGTTVVDGLLAHNSPVRVLTRIDDDRAASLRSRGATTVVGDLHDRGSLLAAVDGVDAIYFTYPIAAGVIPAAANLASAVLESGRRPHVVVMSMVASALGSPSKLGQAQAVAEDVLNWAGLNPSVLRIAGLFQENILTLHAGSIRRDGLISNSFGDGRAPWIGGRDSAELAVAELLKPAPPATAITYPPSVEALSHAEIADIISSETGRRVDYRAVSYQEWKSTLEERAEAEPGPVNRAMAQHISIIGAAFAAGNGPVVTPDPVALTAVLGHPPATFADFVREHRVEFGAPNT
jgi:uncharacterized protein YbjT (DUF2867 family)